MLQLSYNKRKILIQLILGVFAFVFFIVIGLTFFYSTHIFQTIILSSFNSFGLKNVSLHVSQVELNNCVVDRLDFVVDGPKGPTTITLKDLVLRYELTDFFSGKFTSLHITQGKIALPDTESFLSLFKSAPFLKMLVKAEGSEAANQKFAALLNSVRFKKLTANSLILETSHRKLNFNLAINSFPERLALSIVPGIPGKTPYNFNRLKLDLIADGRFESSMSVLGEVFYVNGNINQLSEESSIDWQLRTQSVHNLEKYLPGLGAAGLTDISANVRAKGIVKTREGKLYADRYEVSIDSLSTAYGRLRINDGVCNVEISESKEGYTNAEVNNCVAKMLGGEVFLPVQAIALKKRAKTLTVGLNNLDLARVIKIYPGDVVSGKGRISGELPFVIDDGKVILRRAKIKSVGAGGNVSFQSHTKRKQGQKSDQDDFLQRVLSNFDYQTLKAWIRTYQDSKLEVVVEFNGRNQSYKRGKDISFNIRIVDDSPKILKNIHAINKDHI